MKRDLQITKIVDDAQPIIRALDRFLARKSGVAPIVKADSNEAKHFAIGNRYGRFDEVIIKREVLRSGVPTWFDPREHPGQFGVIGPDGIRIYIAVDLNIDKRNEPSIFDTELLTLAEEEPQQASLFG